MLPEIGASEILVICIVALIVVGPKDLPALLRKLGQMMAKVRGMAAEFRASFDEMARQSELDELRAEVEAMRRGHVAEMASLQASEAEVAQTFDEIGAEMHAATRVEAAPAPAVDPTDGMSAPPAPVTITPVQAAAPEPAPKPRKPRAKKTPTVEGGEKPAPKPRSRRSGTVT
jgi:sec-independent protein translocase protein TatB